MAIRGVIGHNAHCKGIYREAINLKQEGWYVMADHIAGFERPPEIEGFIPDIYAIRNTCTYIIEIETSLYDDREQHKAFKNYARQFSRIRFFVRIVNAAGCRV